MNEPRTAAGQKLLPAIEGIVNWIADVAVSDLPDALREQAKTPYQIHATFHALVCAIEDEAGQIDIDRLTRAMDACLPDEFTNRTPGNAVRAKAIAREYQAVVTE